MRDEMLKKLDELLRSCGIGETGRSCYTGAQTAWLDLREELAAERCENCRSWDSTWPPHEIGACGELPARPITNRSFCCSHFEKKVL